MYQIDLSFTVRETLKSKSKIFLWHSRALVLGVPTDAAPHSHNALQISIGLENDLGLLGPGAQGLKNARTALIGANVMHSFAPSSGPLINLYFDPQSRLGRELGKRLDGRDCLELDLKSVEPVLSDLQIASQGQLSCRDAFTLTESLPQILFHTKKLETDLDPRIVRALQILKNAPDNLISAGAVATEVALSPSRFAHLFRDQVGIPMRRYLSWLRLRNAVRLLGAGESLTTIAHAAGFADAAHFTRTFRQMFGMAPSEIFQNSQFVQVSFCDE